MRLRDTLQFSCLIFTAAFSMLISIGLSAKLVSWLDRQGRLDNIKLFGENDMYNRGW